MKLQDLKDKINSLEDELSKLGLTANDIYLQSDFITEIKDIELNISDYLGNKYIYTEITK